MKRKISNEVNRESATFFSRKTQGGAVLIISLVILMILTILGMAGMSTSALESKMAGNTQATTMALEAAESGSHQQLNSLTKLDPTTVAQQNYTYGSGTVVTASVSIRFIEYSIPIRGAGFSSTGSFQAGNFDQTSEGKTAAALGAWAKTHQGLSQIGAGGS